MRRVHHEVRAVPFAIADETGRAQVDVGDEAELDLASEHRMSPDPRHDEPTPAQAALLARIGYGRAHRDLHYREVVLQVGATVAVHGLGTRSADLTGTPTTSYRDPLPGQLHLAAAPHTPITVTDDPSALR